MSKGEPAANIPHLVFPSVVFLQRSASRSPEGRINLPNSSDSFFVFDNLFHFTRPDVDVLFRFSALSFFLSFPHINSPHHRELLLLSTEEQEDKRYKKIIKINPGCEKVSGPEPESRKHGGDRLASPRSGRSANRRGEKVFTATLFSEFNRRNVMSIKGDKNFNTSICSGNASKPQNLTSGVELLSGCQKMCQVSICFIRCTRFLLFLARFVLNNPQTFFIS